MPLTIDQIKAKQTAELELLITAVMTELRKGESEAIESTLENLRNFRKKTSFPLLQQRANEALQAATSDLLDVALTELGELVAKLDPAGETFKRATEIAKTGEKELLFPMLAANAAKAIELFSEFKIATEKLEKELEGVEDISDLVGSLGNVKDILKSIKAKAEDLIQS